ncbi:MAG: DUF4242 domain-containing protein [Planctomycetaceae bacterium]
MKDQEPQRFVIERDLPGAGSLSPEQLGDIARKSCAVLDELGPSIQWIHSYVTTDKVYCIYSAPNEDLIRRHAALGGFPANRISRMSSIIDPSTARE